jgi:hypothetical protein
MLILMIFRIYFDDFFDFKRLNKIAMNIISNLLKSKNHQKSYQKKS